MASIRSASRDKRVASMRTSAGSIWPKEIVALLSRESQAALKTPEARAAAVRAGYQIVGGTPEQLGARLAAEIALTRELVGRLGLKPQ